MHADALVAFRVGDDDHKKPEEPPEQHMATSGREVKSSENVCHKLWCPIETR